MNCADVTINGNRPWDLQVNHPDFFQPVLQHGSLRFGEAYMNGWWDSQSPDQLLTRLIRAELDKKIRSMVIVYDALCAKLFNRQTRRRSLTVGGKHYDQTLMAWHDNLHERLVRAQAVV